MKDGGPAFARAASDRDDGWVGMSLRDYFAAAALTGLFAGMKEDVANTRGYASSVYAIADAMLAEREKAK